MLDPSDILNKISELSLKQKFNLAKQIYIQCTILFIIAILFFWFTLLSLWFLTFITSPQPYMRQYTPVFVIKQLNQYQLKSVFVNQDRRQLICQANQQTNNHYGYNNNNNNNHYHNQVKSQFDEFRVSLQQFCNIQHDQLPYKFYYSDVDISIITYDVAPLKYITGCIKYANKQYTCQKYPPKTNLKLFKSTNLQQMQYFIIHFQLKNTSIVPNDNTIVRIQQHCFWVVKFFKDHYRIFALIYTYGATVLLTVCIIIVRVIYVMRRYIKYEKQEEQQRGRNRNKTSQVSFGKMDDQIQNKQIQKKNKNSNSNNNNNNNKNNEFQDQQLRKVLEKAQKQTNIQSKMKEQ